MKNTIYTVYKMSTTPICPLCGRPMIPRQGYDDDGKLTLYWWQCGRCGYSVPVYNDSIVDNEDNCTHQKLAS